MTDHTDGSAGTFEYPTKAEGIVTRDTDDGEQDLIKVPVSSTRADREGDRFAAEALEEMAGQIKDQQPMVFDNHGLAGGFMDAIPYDARETIGAQVDAEVQEGDDGEQTLFAYVNPDESHPEGERMVRQVRDEDQPIKFSVGFGIKGYEEREEVEDDYEGDGRVFTAADLMETSRVGIPANPDASVEAAAAKDGNDDLAGYRMHPFFQAMRGQGPAALATKDAATDGGEDLHEQLDALREENAELRQTVADLAEKVEDDDKGSCDGDGDCPDGEVCVDGECVPEDEVDDDDEDEDSAETEDAELRARIEELEEALEAGTAAPESKDTTTEEPDLTDESGEPDADADAEPEETGTAHETLFE